MSSPFPPPGNQDPFGYNPQPGNTGYGAGQYGGQQFGGQQLGSPGYGFPPPPPASLSLPALFSLLLSIASPLFICACLPYLTAIVSLAGIVMGHIALVGINRSGGTRSGRGLAMGGLVVGYPVFLLGLLISSLFLLPAFLPKDFGKRPPGHENTPDEIRSPRYADQVSPLLAR